MASEVNFGLWPLLMGLLEYFQNPSQNIHHDAISISIGLLGPALALLHYFEVNFGLWPLLMVELEYFQKTSQNIHNF